MFANHSYIANHVSDSKPITPAMSGTLPCFKDSHSIRLTTVIRTALSYKSLSSQFLSTAWCSLPRRPFKIWPLSLFFLLSARTAKEEVVCRLKSLAVLNQPFVFHAQLFIQGQQSFSITSKNEPPSRGDEETIKLIIKQACWEVNSSPRSDLIAFWHWSNGMVIYISNVMFLFIYLSPFWSPFP